MTYNELKELPEVPKLTELFHKPEDALRVTDFYGNVWTTGWHDGRLVRKLGGNEFTGSIHDPFRTFGVRDGLPVMD